MIGRDEDKMKKVAQQVDQFFNIKIKNKNPNALPLITYIIADIAEIK